MEDYRTGSWCEVRGTLSQTHLGSFIIHRMILAVPSASGILPFLMRLRVDGLIPISLAISRFSTSNSLWKASKDRPKFVMPHDCIYETGLQSAYARGIGFHERTYEGALIVSGYSAWCEERGVTHAHCPHDCYHPQPQVAQNGDLICMRCAVLEGRYTVMEPCTPDVCEDGH
jgi:hypothetical protein